MELRNSYKSKVNVVGGGMQPKKATAIAFSNRLSIFSARHIEKNRSMSITENSLKPNYSEFFLVVGHSFLNS